MGTDVSIYTAVLVSPLDTLPLFSSRSLAVAFAKFCLNRYEGSDCLISPLTENDRILVSSVWSDDDGKVEDRGSARERLASIKSGKALHALFVDLTFAAQRGEVGNCDGTWIENDGLLIDLWNQYLKVLQHFSKAELPLVTGVETFGNSLSGWEGNFGHPYLTFSVHEVLTYRPTEKGKRLEESLGFELSPKSWANVSY
jgi:hypothetical protein